MRSTQSGRTGRAVAECFGPANGQSPPGGGEQSGFRALAPAEEEHRPHQSEDEQDDRDELSLRKAERQTGVQAPEFNGEPEQACQDQIEHEENAVRQFVPAKTQQQSKPGDAEQEFVHRGGWSGVSASNFE